MRYLIDTSALVRLYRRQVDPAWYELVDRGLIAMCEPVLCEALTIAGAKRYDEVERQFNAAYPWVPVPDGAWDLVAAIRRELAQHSAHAGRSVADLVVAATAMRLKLELLHDDADFETVARYVPALRQRRVSVPPG